MHGTFLHIMLCLSTSGFRFSNMKITKKIVGFAKKRWYILIVLFLVGGFFVNKQMQATAQAKKSSTYTVGRMTLKEDLSLSGTINAEEHVTLQFQTAGLLSWVGVKEGDYVKKYQGIAALDQRSVTKNLQKNLNDYAKSRNTYEQSKDDNSRVGDQPTHEQGDKMKRLLENAQYDLTSSVFTVELQDLAKQYSYLTTPIDGIVIRADAKYPGVNIGITSTYEVVNPKTIFFSALADQTDVVKLQKDMKAAVQLDSYPEKKMDGTIYFISFIPKAGETGTVYEIKMALNDNANEQNAYRLGMTGDATFTLQEKNNVITIPSTYIKTEGDKKYVWKSTKGKEEKKYIKTGLEVDGNSEILSGIDEGDVLTNSVK